MKTLKRTSSLAFFLLLLFCPVLPVQGQTATNDDCLLCHQDESLTKTLPDGKEKSLFVHPEKFENTVHGKLNCVDCHRDLKKVELPHAENLAPADCQSCHAEVMQTYRTSTHGQLNAKGDPNGPTCRDCHTAHEIRGRKDPQSATYPLHIPELCGQCHRQGEKAAVRLTGEKQLVVQNYIESIHGKGLLESGLLVTATCVSCHTPHGELPAADPASTVHRSQITQTCGRCHGGIYEKFAKSVHAAGRTGNDKVLPVCSDCHSAHTITRTDQEQFKFQIIDQCGKCHEAVAATYFDTFHGKVSRLGFTGAAKCFDCHGAHDILPREDSASRLSKAHIVSTCARCHSGAHPRFTGYLTHATHHDPEKYPVLYYAFLGMTILLIGTFGFFGLHTLLWLPRAFLERKKKKGMAPHPVEKEYLRFDRFTRQLHVLVIVSFLGLALTGMTLKFSDLGWAKFLSKLLGGFESTGYIHRICALVTFFYFGLHLFDLVRKKRRDGRSWWRFLTGPDSMLPNKNDAREFWGTLKWFVGLGPRPAYGRWTYWEKFDYFAVFWGVTIIGASGLVLWFPVLFTHMLPGWFINVATLIHSDEALLAVGFIFVIHFFNTQLRPDKFPSDPVIFTGRVPVEELKEERPREYAEAVEKGELESRLVEPLSPRVVRGMKIFGWTALSIGIILILLILWAEISR